MFSASAGATAAEPSVARARARPNFLFILADDWGWGDTSAYRGGAKPTDGSFHLTGTRTYTPALDKLAAEGTLFTDFHTAQAFCAPSRTAFMTGRWPADLRVNSNWDVTIHGAASNKAAGLPYYTPLPTGADALPNVAYVLQQAGWATCHLGKWHLGGVAPEGERTPRPSDYGFDFSATHSGPVQSNRSLVDAHNIVAGNTSDRWWSADVDGVVRDYAIDFMRNASGAGRPFYVNLWLHMSHDTIDPRPEQYQTTYPFDQTCLFASKAAGQTICPSQIFWGAQTYTDSDRVAPLLAAVDELGVRDTTYVVWSSDNGAQGDKWTSSKPGAFDNAVGTQGPFRGCKASLYDGGHRVNLIVRGPGVPSGRIDHSLLSAVDWLPTVASLANAAIPNGTLLRGKDVSDIWLGKRSDVTHRGAGYELMWRSPGGAPAPCWNHAPALAVRQGDWKLLLNPDYDAPATQKRRFPRVELYNMSVGQLGTDRMGGAFFEATNMAGANGDVIAQLAAPLLRWHRAVGPNKPGQTDAQLSKAAQGCEAYPFPGVARSVEGVEGAD